MIGDNNITQSLSVHSWNITHIASLIVFISQVQFDQQKLTEQVNDTKYFALISLHRNTQVYKRICAF